MKNIYSNSEYIEHHGSKLETLDVQTSTYNRKIPIIYGTMKISGNIIWAKPIKELIAEKKDIKYINDKNIITSHFTYNYNATFAIAICEGIIEKLLTIWANDQILDLQKIKYRFYKGNEEQIEDPIIKEIEKKCPAYRGISYIVIEDFPLQNYNNKIPNFKFEVKAENYYQNNLSNKIYNISILPGSGEFIYDTQIIKKITQKKIGNRYVFHGDPKYINKNSDFEESDALVSLRQLHNTLPNLEWISVVVNWYYDDINIKKCNIYPAVEFQNTEKILYEDWNVANISRHNTNTISSITALGTVNDASLKRFLKELKSRHYKIMLYPKLMIDSHDPPYYSRLTGDVKDIEHFFQKKYNPFIKHYCNIAKELSIDSFIIGSELSELTKLYNDINIYPAVDELIALAAFVKKHLPNATVTYAADYKEYHSSNHQYNMDNLWSSPNIDVVGINAYFPLIEKSHNSFNKQDIIDGWNKGEGYEYFYSNEKKIYYLNNSKQYAWKNLEQWWNSIHINNNGTQSKWNKKMKKIWFISYGFLSIKNCASLSDTLTSHNKLSKLDNDTNSDFQAQKISIEGTIERWENSIAVEKMFLWGWDIRPYPYFPNLPNYWKDAKNWSIDYNIQGKLFELTIHEILQNIFKRIEIQDYIIDLSQTLIQGYAIIKDISSKDVLQNLQDLFFFDIVEQDSRILIRKKARNYECKIPIGETVIVNNNNYCYINRERKEINQINLLYVSQNYEINVRYARITSFNNSDNKQTIESPIILHHNQAQDIVRILIEENLAKDLIFTFMLPIKYLYLNVSDIIKIVFTNEKEYIFKIIRLEILNYNITITGLSHHPSIYK